MSVVDKYREDSENVSTRVLLEGSSGWETYETHLSPINLLFVGDKMLGHTHACIPFFCVANELSNKCSLGRMCREGCEIPLASHISVLKTSQQKAALYP